MDTLDAYSQQLLCSKHRYGCVDLTSGDKGLMVLGLQSEMLNAEVSRQHSLRRSRSGILGQAEGFAPKGELYRSSDASLAWLNVKPCIVDRIDTTFPISPVSGFEEDGGVLSARSAQSAARSPYSCVSSSLASFVVAVAQIALGVSRPLLRLSR